MNIQELTDGRTEERLGSLKFEEGLSWLAILPLVSI
jgi:hypothetical protein